MSGNLRFAAGPEMRQAATVLVGVFLATRLIAILLAASIDTTIPLSFERQTYTNTPGLASLTSLDADYYLGIAAEGYHADPVHLGHRDWVFFPLYPLVVRAASVLTLGDVALAGVLVANAAFLAAMFVLYRLSRIHLSHEASLRAVTYLAIAPGAVAFAMAYSDSLFLLLSTAAFLAAERRRWWLVGILYALACLTRLPGLALGIPLAVIAFQAAGRRPTVGAAWLALGPAAVAAFYAYLGTLFGDPLANLRAQATWQIGSIVDASSSGSQINPLAFVLIGTLLFFVFLLVYFLPDRVPLPYALLAVLSLVVVLVSGRLQSVGRYLVVAWPFSWVLANRQSAVFHAVWPIASTGLFVFHAAMHFTQALAP